MIVFFARFLLATVALLCAGVPARAADLPKPEYVQIKLYATASHAAAGEPFTVIIEQLIEPEWHTYWKNPGDSGTPTNVKWTLPEGGAAGVLREPIPSRIPYGPLMNFGYSNRALFAVDITPPAEIKGNTYTVQADIDWLVCKDICLPEGDRFTLTLPVSKAGPQVNETITDILHDLTATHPVQVSADAWQAAYRDEGDQTIITFTPSAQALEILNQGGRVEFFPIEWGLIQNASEQVLVLTDTGQAMLSIPKGDRDRAQLPNPLPVLLTVHDGHGHVQGYETTLAAAINPAMTPTPTTAATTAATSAPGQAAAIPAGPTLLGVVFLALISGMILNLMPCVFPILSLKILSLAQLSGAEKEQMRPHGLAYGAGVITTFIVIAGILMILQQAGSAIGWGFQLQQPGVIALLAYLFAVIGFNLMGWFEVDLVRYIPARLHGHHEGLAGSFGTGMLATIVATPCTAPFMGAALGYALTQHPAIGLLVFAALGLGLALPFVILTFIPHLHRYLPRPGAWMITLRQVLAFPMFAAVLWLIWVLGHQTGSNGAGLALAAIVVIGLILWLARLPRPGRKAWRIVRQGAMILAAMTLIPLTTAQWDGHLPTVEERVCDHQTVYSSVILKQALATDQPIFVNMTAAWCITCKLNERVAIQSDSVKKLFTDSQMIYIKGDWTNYNADITEFLSSYGRKGVPLYVYYPAPDASGMRPDPIILPQLLTPAIITNTITRNPN